MKKRDSDMNFPWPGQTPDDDDVRPPAWRRFDNDRYLNSQW
jgi:hypothetical protein